MSKIGLLVDSTTLTREDIVKPYLKVASLGVTIDGTDYTEVELGHERMTEMLPHAKKMLSSQPAPGAFLECYKEFHEEGYDQVLVITLSEKLSGTFQSALLAKSMIDFDLDIFIQASTVASFGVALGIPLIEEKIESGASFEEVIALTQIVYENAQVTFTLQNLMHLFHGGRLNRVSALLGTVLRIKPIVEMLDGKLELTRKERTNNACFDFFMSKIEEAVAKFKEVYVDFIELNRKEFSDRFEEVVQTRFPNLKYHITRYVSPVFSVHLGDQGYGISIVAL